MSDTFTPTLAAAQARLARVRPAEYARSRNHLDGAVTALSAWLTHGLLTVPQAVASIAARHALPLQHKLVQEFGWREFFHQVWRQRGESIFDDLHAGPRPASAYQRSLPEDIRQARCGVPAIDQAVRTLYATGHLHNHARMWLASYVVHLRGVHWRAGADWLYAHLLDGDLASNHLSWQWVAGTGSHKPYLFNAENVARYAGTVDDGAWLSPRSLIDTGYDTLEAMAQQGPPAHRAPPGLTGTDEPRLWTAPPPGTVAPALPDAAMLAGRTVWLVHPWALAEPPADLPADALRLAVWPAEHHMRWAWRAARWRFVAARTQALGAGLPVWADTATLRQALAGAARVISLDNLHLPADWPAAWRQPVATLLGQPARRCDSFSQFWRATTAKAGALSDLPGWPGGAAPQGQLFD